MMSVGCPICQETFRDVKSCVVTRCGHAFDEHCVLDWIQRSRTCPSCRAPCNAHCLTKVFFSLVPDDSEAAEELRQRLEASEVKAAIFFSRNEISKKKLMDMEMEKEILIRDNKDQQLRMENSVLDLKKEIKQLNGKIKQLENTHKQKMGHLNHKIKQLTMEVNVKAAFIQTQKRTIDATCRIKDDLLELKNTPKNEDQVGKLNSEVDNSRAAKWRQNRRRNQHNGAREKNMQSLESNDQIKEEATLPNIAPKKTNH